MATQQTSSGRRTITLSGMYGYPKGMFGFRLPPGYRVQVAPDVLVLRRPDGLMVAAFIAPVADPTEVEREAREDHRRCGESGHGQIASLFPRSIHERAVGGATRRT